jgi:hypothetical protein
MNNWRLPAGFVVAAAVGMLVATHGPAFDSVAAQQPAGGWVQPKTAWGDPDLQGVWRYEASVPLERPAQLQGRASLTDEEVAQRQKLEEDQEAQRLAGAEGVAVGRGNLEQSPDSWQRIQQLLAGSRSPASGLQSRRRSSLIPPTAESHTHPTRRRPRREPRRATARDPTSRISIPIPANGV